jgi:hypothetical protein
MIRRAFDDWPCQERFTEIRITWMKLREILKTWKERLAQGEKIAAGVLIDELDQLLKVDGEN